MTLSDRILVPVASETDAKRTCTAIIASLSDEAEPSTIVVVHVIEKGGGTVDKAPLPAREEQAETIFQLARSQLENSGFDVETELLYGTDVVDTIVTATVDFDTTSILFLPRSQGRLSRLLTGDLSTTLILESPVPVITLPQPSEIA